MIAADMPPSDIVVTATRPADQSADERLGAIIIGADRIRQSGSGRIEDALSRVAGLQSFRRSDSRSANPSAQGLTLRGLGGNASSRTLVMLDGIPITDPFFGYVPLSAIDPRRVDRITVMRGAGGGAFGSAVAGTIGIESKPLASRDPLDGAMAVSSEGATQISGGLTHRFGAGAMTLDGRWDRGQGFWTTPREQRVPASVQAAYNSRQGDARFVSALAGGEVQARLRFFADDRVLRFRGADSSMSGTDASLSYVSADQSLTVAGWRQWRDFSNIVVSASSFRPVLDQYATPASSSGAIVQWRAAPWLMLGGDIKGSTGSAKERALSAASGAVTAVRSNGGDVREAAAFAEAQASIGSLTLAGSTRLAAWRLADGRSVERDGAGNLLVERHFDARGGTALSGRASAVWQGNGWSVRSAAYRGFRLPTLNELYRGFTVFPVTTSPNPELEPERLTGAEVGVMANVAPGLSVTTTLFANRLAKAIGNVTIGPNLRERQNIDAIRSRGVEAEVAWRRDDWAIDSSLSLVSARVEQPGDLDGMRPAQVPKMSLTLAAARSFGRSEVSATLRHVSGAYEDDLNRDRLPPATTIDVVARHHLNSAVEISLRGENLLDLRVVTRNQAGSIDLGAPRTVWLMLALKRSR